MSLALRLARKYVQSKSECSRCLQNDGRKTMNEPRNDFLDVRKTCPVQTFTNQCRFALRSFFHNELSIITSKTCPVQTFTNQFRFALGSFFHNELSFANIKCISCVCMCVCVCVCMCVRVCVSVALHFGSGDLNRSATAICSCLHFLGCSHI